jgi:hypothetical protein
MLAFRHILDHDEGGLDGSEALYGRTDYWVIAEADVRLSQGRNVRNIFREMAITSLLNIFIAPTSTSCYKW